MSYGRNGLRPVRVEDYGKVQYGYFHQFSVEGDFEQGVGTFAVVELENGEVIQVDAYRMVFTDVN